MIWPPSLEQLRFLSSLSSYSLGVLPRFVVWLAHHGWGWVVGFDLAAVLAGMVLLVDLLLRLRISVSTIMLSLLFFFVSPLVLFLALGYGQGLLFFLLSLYIWLTERVPALEVRTQTILLIIFSSLFLVLAPDWVGPLVGAVVFVWAVRIRLLERPRKRTILGLSLIVLFLAGVFLWFNPVPVFDGWNLLSLWLLIYGLVPLALGLFLAKDSIWAWAGWVYVVVWLTLSFIKGIGPSSYLLLPAAGLWFLALGIGLDRILGRILSLRRLALTLLGVGLFVWMAWVISGDLALRSVDFTRLLAIKLDILAPNSLILSRELNGLELVLPSDLKEKTVFEDEVRWEGLVRKASHQLEKIVFLGSYALTSQLAHKYPFLSFEPILSFELLDCSESHGIIPFLRDYWISQVKVSDEDACSGI